MTVIAVVRSQGAVCMASDSQATHNGGKATIPSKIVRCGPLLVGCGSFPADNFVRHLCVVQGWGPNVSLVEYLVRDFVPMLRHHFAENGLMTKDARGDPEFPGMMMVAKDADFALIDGVGSVVTIESPWWAIGSGCGEARGALHASWRRGATVASRSEAELLATKAVEAAIALDDGCGPPVRMEWTT